VKNTPPMGCNARRNKKYALTGDEVTRIKKITQASKFDLLC
jgi:hypothetical protein